uniref:Zona pellucida sperm-binding protein 3 n=1 Tax=Jaculus jaculus TaxID=51337 RepID=A0A8C5K365_JACJA
VTEDALVYSTFLLHDPRPVGNQAILRTNRVEVPIECHYPRQGNVSSLAIQPTWVPFSTTVSSEEKLAFSLRLMEENWDAEKLSPTFHLGEAAYLQAEVHTGSHLPLQLFVDHCVATPSPDHTVSPYHVIVDFHGWWPVEGTADICECCNNSDCSFQGSSKNQTHKGNQWPRSASRIRRHVTEEADVTVGPLIFLGKASEQAVEGWTSSSHTSVVLGSGLATAAFLILAAIVLGVSRRCPTSLYPVSSSQ